MDPTKNLQLAAVLRRAREMDVPKENIEKALAKVCPAMHRSFPTCSLLPF